MICYKLYSPTSHLIQNIAGKLTGVCIVEEIMWKKCAEDDDKAEL